ncbi:extracellular solute-binding protein [Brachybacterium sp. NPDC056505]|uniref:extracellular solute-binding protein n=1 Tax=Brachybacterium sp. NPDC056505 TaxID=3345843 RepID=UPI0036701584
MSRKPTAPRPAAPYPAPHPASSGLRRRSLLSGAGLGVAGIAGASALAGCGGSAGGAGSPASISKDLAELPTYTAITKGPKPDLPGSDIVQPAYFAPPQTEDLWRSVDDEHMPQASDPVSAFIISYSTPPPSNNPFLDEVDERLGTDLDLRITSSETFSQKFATVVAGGDVPDMVEFIAFDLPANYPQLLDAQFADLTELLSGDAIADYPNLANVPSISWENCRVNGKIFGTPVHRPAFGSIMVSRPDLFEEILGEEPAPDSEDEFTAMLTEVTDSTAGRYAMTGQSAGSAVDWGWDFLGAMFGVPNGWGLQDDALVHKFETDAWFETLEYIKKLWDLGVYHPDTPSTSGSQAKAYLAAGTVLLHQDGISALLDKTSPKAPYDAIVPFAADGGAGIMYQGSSLFSFTALKKAEDDRLVEQLKILNYLAAPFGSEENFFLTYGTEGEHHTRAADGSVSLTEAGTAQITPSAVSYLSAPPQVLFSAVPLEDRLTRDHTWQSATESMLLKSAVAGLYSPTSSKASSAEGDVLTAATEYVLGRAALKPVHTAVESWKSGFGDTMREEYTEQLD